MSNSLLKLFHYKEHWTFYKAISSLNFYLETTNHTLLSIATSFKRHSEEINVKNKNSFPSTPHLEQNTLFTM